MKTMLPDSRNPIGRIARLKADRAGRYETALLIQTNNTLNISTGGPPADAQTILSRLTLTDLDRHAMAGLPVISPWADDAPALPPGEESTSEPA